MTSRINNCLTFLLLSLSLHNRDPWMKLKIERFKLNLCSNLFQSVQLHIIPFDCKYNKMPLPKQNKQLKQQRNLSKLWSQSSLRHLLPPLFQSVFSRTRVWHQCWKLKEKKVKLERLIWYVRFFRDIILTCDRKRSQHYECEKKVDQKTNSHLSFSLLVFFLKYFSTIWFVSIPILIWKWYTGNLENVCQFMEVIFFSSKFFRWPYLHD